MFLQKQVEEFLFSSLKVRLCGLVFTRIMPALSTTMTKTKAEKHQFAVNARRAVANAAPAQKHRKIII